MDDYVVNIAVGLLEALAHMPGCLGLSALQMGKARRVIAVDAGQGGKQRGAMVVVDPVVAAQTGSEILPESCASIPGSRVFIRRPTHLFVRGLVMFVKDGNFEMAERVEVRGVEARALAHQLDHLEGVLIYDRAASRSERLSAARPPSARG
jgi:peptide deformylase